MCDVEMNVLPDPAFNYK